MTELSFPASPNIGDKYTASNGAVYVYDGTKWATSGVKIQLLSTPNTNNRFIYSDGVNVIWEPPPMTSESVNIYPPQDATDENGDNYTWATMPLFIANSNILSKASQWQFSIDDPTFSTLVHDTGVILYELQFRIYSQLNPTVQIDTSVVGGNTLIDSGSLSSGTLYWRVRFQDNENDAWTAWTDPTSFGYQR